jgi:hypothetical protein
MVDAVGPREIVERHRADLPALPQRNGLDCLSVFPAPPRPHLNENDCLLVLADDVNFSKAGAVPPGKNCVPATLQFAAREIFPGFSDELAIGRMGHASGYSNGRARKTGTMNFIYFMIFMSLRKASMSGQIFAPLRLWPEKG